MFTWKTVLRNLFHFLGRELFQFNADIGGDDDEAEDIVREKQVEVQYIRNNINSQYYKVCEIFFRGPL